MTNLAARIITPESAGWPCPKCGAASARSVQHPACRECPECGHRASMEAFCPPIAGKERSDA